MYISFFFQEPPLVFPNATDYMDISSSSFEYPMDNLDDMFADLNVENDSLIARTDQGWG